MSDVQISIGFFNKQILKQKKHLIHRFLIYSSRFPYMSSSVFCVHHMFVNLRLVFFKDLQKNSVEKAIFIHPSTHVCRPIPSLDSFHCQALTATSLAYAMIIRAAVPPCHRRSRWKTCPRCRCRKVSPVSPEKQLGITALFFLGVGEQPVVSRIIGPQYVKMCHDVVGCFLVVFGRGKKWMFFQERVEL